MLIDRTYALGYNGFHLDFDPTAGQVYSSGTLTGSIHSGNPLTRAFDGNLTTGTWAGSSSGFELTFPSAETVANSITVVGGSSTTNYKVIVGGTEHTITFPNGSSSYTQEVTVNVSGSFTGIKATSNHGEIRGIRIDGGPLLVDHEAPGVDASGSGNHWTPTNFSLLSTDLTHWRQATSADNPSSNTTGSISYRPFKALTEPVTGSLIWDHQNTQVFGLQNITGITSLRLLISSRGSAKLGINTGAMFSFGTHGGDYNNAQANAAWYTVSNPPSTLTSIAGTGGGSGTGNFMSIWAIEVNGVRVLDTSASDNDSLFDSPSNYDDGTNIGGNYATLVPFSNVTGYYGNATNGNLDFIGASGHWNSAVGSISIPSTGKWFWETTFKGGAYSPRGTGSLHSAIGFAKTNVDLGNSLYDHANWIADNGYGINFGDSNSRTEWYAGDIHQGMVVGIAVDRDANTYQYYVDGTSVQSGTLGVSSGIDLIPVVFVYHNSYTSHALNFGQRPFKHPVSGFKPLCAQSLPDPLIADPSTAFDVALWNGNGSSAQTISTPNLSPDMVWYKERSNTSSHGIVDSVRGATNAAKVLYPDRPDVEATGNSTQSITSLNNNGFTIGSSDNSINQSSQTYVGWAWEGGNLATNSAYIQSAVWSDGITGSALSGYPATNGFNGDTSTYFYAAANQTTTFTFSPAISGTTFEVFMYGGGANPITVNGTDAGSATGAWVNVSSQAGGSLSTIACVGGSSSQAGFSAVRVDNKLVIDAGVVPVGSLNSTVYNTSSNWSVAGSNMQNNWSDSFDGGMDDFAIPNTGYSSSMTFPSAISYQTLELVVSRDLYGPDLLVNGNSLNVPKTDTNQTNGRYKKERYYFQNGTLTSIGHETRNTAGQGGSGFWQIIVDGKILVDTNQASSAPNVPSIATTCTSNQTAGFAISTYKGNSTDRASVATNLGSTPEMVIVKARDKSDDWRVYHVGAGNPYYLRLQLNNDRSGTNNWREMSLNYFALDADSAVNSSSYNYVAYSFSSVEGYSLVSSYQGQNKFVHCGFRPRFLLIKSATSTEHWAIYDTERSPFNHADDILKPNSSDDEDFNYSSGEIDILSNGFKLVGNWGAINHGSTPTYVFLAIAENPFKYARAR